ncbi:hypothetical protein [Brytella acorum]|uniref:Uncharacterized protein n=1 Tax=Brytella acorum TaxID=2959299 RepID=A0AA35V1N0_9PROT|nr:hypothetical protein [Brytella acorum]MDF3625104.1 hypothetical protein [Brytella acorum]CAI9121017.1 hypothetical protein LMG32879_001861 [Brytella acorum]
MTSSAVAAIPAAQSPLLEGITQDGCPIRNLYDRWEPEQRLQLSPEVQCLLLRDSDSGREAVWYLDTAGCYLGSHIEVTHKFSADAILAPLERDLIPLTLSSLATMPTEGPGNLPALPQFLAIQLAIAWMVRHPSAISPTQDKQHLTDDRIHLTLATRSGEGPLLTTSPYSSRPLLEQIVFSIEGQRVYRFYDETVNSAFYLAWDETQLDQTPALYCPTAELLISDQPNPTLLPARILAWYMSHPEHIEDIHNASVLSAQEYGLGSASRVSEIPEAPGHLTENTSKSEAWQYLTNMPDSDVGAFSPTQPETRSTSATNPHRPGLLSRLKGMFRRR